MEDEVTISGEHIHPLLVLIYLLPKPIILVYDPVSIYGVTTLVLVFVKEVLDALEEDIVGVGKNLDTIFSLEGDICESCEDSFIELLSFSFGAAVELHVLIVDFPGGKFVT